MTERRSSVTPSNADASSLSNARTSPHSRDDSPTSSDVSASNFMVYIPERRGTSVLFSLNQLLCDSSQGAQGLGPLTDGTRSKIPVDSNRM